MAATEDGSIPVIPVAAIKAEDLINGCTFRNQQIVSDILSKKTTLVTLVESLGSVLTHEDKDIRKRGVEYLSWVLSQLPPDFLSEKELTYFSLFYCDRLKDHHSIIPVALQGILSLVKTSKIAEKCVGELVQSVFQQVTWQAQVAADRRVLYLIVQACWAGHRACVQALGADLVYGLVTGVEGETDPQNLLLVFHLLPPLVASLPVDHLTSDIFEVFSTYFPVDFTTVKKDGVVISREDLALGLSHCLTATAPLACLCLPLILEKLDSTLKTAKLDSYRLLQRCCDRLDAEHLDASAATLWRALQRDLLPPRDAAVQREAQLALTALAGKLCSQEVQFTKFLDDVIVGVRSLMGQPEDSLFVPAMRVLEALCPASSTARRRVLLELQVLCRAKTRSDAELLALLDALLPFLACVKADSPALEPVATLCLDAVTRGSEAVRDSAFRSLQRLYQELAPSARWRQAVYASILWTIQNSSKSLAECCKLLRLVCKTNSVEASSEIHAVLKSFKSDGAISVQTFFSVSAAIVDIPELYPAVIAEYVSLGKDRRENTWQIVFESVLVTCDRGAEDWFYEALLEVLLDWVEFWAKERHLPAYRPLALLLQRVFSRCQAALQATAMAPHSTLARCVAAIMDGDRGGELVVVMEGYLGCLRPGLAEACGVGLDLAGALMSMARSSAVEQVRESAARLLAALVNKMPVGLAHQVLREVEATLEDIDGGPYLMGLSVALLAWVLKGALLRGLSEVDACIGRWFALLDRADVSRAVAACTKGLVKEDPVFLNASCHCTVKYLYRQRLFCHVPTLAQSMRAVSDRALKDNYLLALVQLACNVPPELLRWEESAVALVVAQAMVSGDAGVVEPALHLLHALLLARASLFADHVTSLLPALLRLAGPPCPLPVRRCALQCLFLAGNYPTQLTLPYRAEVVRSLLPSLDDRKRLVRAEATRARSRWCLVGAVGEEAAFPS